MNRTRGLLKRTLAGAAMTALVALSTAAHAQAPGAADPAATSAAPGSASPAAPAGPASPAAPAAPPSNAPAPGAANDVTLDAPPSEPSHRTAWPWIIIGTGIALVVTATVLEIHAVSEDDQRTADEDKLFSLPQGDPQRQPLVDSAASHDKSASTSRTEALVIGSVGFVAVAGAVVLWFVEGGSSGSSASAPAASNNATTKRKLPSILPRLAPGYAGGLLGGTF